MIARLLLPAVLFLAACGGQERPRCAECGMFADAAPRWSAGATEPDGTALRFDAPRCFFAQRARTPGLRDAWVTEYYSQARRAAADVSYVVGSDLTGPMGKDLVPVEAANSARFVQEHGGHVVTYGAVDAAVLRGLDR